MTRYFSRPSLSLAWILGFSLLCLILWGTVLYHLDHESMWYDEWFTWQISSQGPIGLITATAQDVHPPLYYHWVWLWRTLLQSDDLWLMRFTSVVPAVLSLALTARLALEWSRSRWLALGAAAAMAVGGIWIYYARELRMYSLVVLLVLLSWWALTRALKQGGRARWLYGVMLALLAYTYYFAAFIVVAQLIVALIVLRRRFTTLIPAYLLALALFAPWIPVLFQQLALEKQRAGSDESAALGKFAATLPTNLATISSFIHQYSAGQAGLFGLLLVFAAGVTLVQKGRVRTTLNWAWLWLVGTLVLVWGLNLVIPVYHPRYVLTVYPALALLVGGSFLALKDVRLRTAGLAALVLIGLGSHTAAFPDPKTPHRELLEVVNAGFQPGDRIWYNFSYGGLGSSLENEVSYHLSHDAPRLTSDDFVWDAPHDYQNVTRTPRVWDVRPYWIPMPEEAGSILMRRRVLTQDTLIGPYTVRLYEAEPTTDAMLLGDLFGVKTSGLSAATVRPGETITVKSWWQAFQQPERDYSYTLHLRRAGEISSMFSVDNGLTLGTMPTSQWSVASKPVYQALSLPLPATLPAGSYEVWITGRHPRHLCRMVRHCRSRPMVLSVWEALKWRIKGGRPPTRYHAGGLGLLRRG
jgi:hypothetical protein